ncbi:MAG: carbohydrate binding domain-containing protein [Clostridia bacterium]|nr:carbohydrate binding domain-containing protein [Clostridia bacterium]
MKCKYYVILFAMTALLCSLLVVSPLLSVAAADNLAANGDLEMGNTGGWEIDSAAIDSSVKYAGNYSLKLTATTAYNGAAYKIVPVGKNATVTVSFYYRYASNPGAKLYHVYTYQGENPYNGVYSKADATFNAPSIGGSISTWKKISYTFNSGDYAKIYLKFCPGGNGGAACYIDNLVVTATGGTQEKVAPYLTSFGTRYNRPSSDSHNVIKSGSFESTANAAWNTDGFINEATQVVEDTTAPEGDKSLYFDSANTTARSAFSLTVEPYTQYVFSAWVKSPRLSTDNRATATFGIADEKGDFLVYERYNGNGYGAASLSTTKMQLMATAPDDAWHLRSVTFYSGTASMVNVVVTGTDSRLYLDGIALYKSAYGVEYISPLRNEKLSATTNNGNKYCADENSLIPYPHMTGKAAENHWSANPAWRNGFLSFESVDDGHGTVLKYTASAKPVQLAYIDWIDVEPNTDYVLTLDVKRLTAGGGKIMLLDDNVLSPAEFYTVSFSSTDSDWKTYSVSFNSGVYSRVGFGIVDGGGQVYMDKIRLFKTLHATSTEPEDLPVPATYPKGGLTAVMEMAPYVPTNAVVNGTFETGTANGWDRYQGATVSANAKRLGSYGMHLRGDGSYGALLEQRSIPVTANEHYSFSFWFKVNNNGANWMLQGEQSDTIYASGWITAGAWNMVLQEFDCGADTSLLLNFCGGGNGVPEDLYVDDFSLINLSGGPTLGVGFRIDLAAEGVAMTEFHKAYLKNSTVDVYGDGVSYPLKRMGCVVTNQAQIGQSRTAFKLDNLDVENRTVIDVPAVYLCQTTANSVSYAVRVIEIPYRARDTYIYARPYYVFERDGEEVVVYGDIYSRSYTDANGNDPFTIA